MDETKPPADAEETPGPKADAGAEKPAAPPKPKPKPKIDVGAKLREAVPSACLDRLKETQADAIAEEPAFYCGVPIVRVKPDSIAEVCRFLKNDPKTQMTHLSNLCGVDMIGLDRPEPRFDVVYNLFSVETRERITLRVAVGEDPGVPTVSTVWRTAGWHEREAFDMFGIRFDGHPDLRRILMPDEFDAFPLRKDFPLEGRDKDHGYWRTPEDDTRYGSG